MFPRWLSWMFLITMGYVIFSASQVGQSRGGVQPSQTVVPAITKENYPALAETADVERWKRKLNPDYAAKANCSADDLPAHKGLDFKLIVDEKGDGAPAACGDTIRVKLTIWSPSGEVAYAGELPLAIGARELAAGLDVGLVGIMKGEGRSLILPPHTLVHAKASKAPAEALKALPATHIAYVSVKRVE